MHVTNLLPAHYVEHVYFRRVLAAFDPEVFKARRVVMTADYNALPFYGADVVVLLTAGDERGNPPKYRDRVGFVFKHHQNVDCIGGNCYHMPLTYVDDFAGDAAVPMAARRYVVCFIGRHSKRQDFQAAAAAVKARYGDRACIRFTGHKFRLGMSLAQYADAMRSSCIALSPRGAVRAECLRFTEAVKCGCAIIACRQPDVRVFRNCPYIAVDAWTPDGLVKTVEKLLADLAGLERRRVAMMRCWEHYFSPEAVGLYISKIVRGPVQ